MDRPREQHLMWDTAATEPQFRALFEAAPDALLILGSDHRILLVNTQAEALFGYPREELIGEAVEKLMPERFATQLFECSMTCYTSRRASLPRRSQRTDLRGRTGLVRLKSRPR